MAKGPISATHKWIAKNHVMTSTGSAIDETENCSATDVFFNKEFQKDCFAITCMPFSENPDNKIGLRVTYCYSIGIVEMASINNDRTNILMRKKQ
jgi:hypothetical protein